LIVTTRALLTLQCFGLYAQNPYPLPGYGQIGDTGLDTETVIFPSLEGFTFELKCPRCGTIHKWTTARAWIEREKQ
jgi:hypothetical protein